MIKLISFAARYFYYLKKSKHYNGHGIHSPFIYDFTRKIIFSTQNCSHFKEIKLIAKELKNDNTIIKISDYGAGSLINKNPKQKVKNIAKIASTNMKYGKLLYRMVDYFNMKNIIELGTSLGAGTLYLAYSQKGKVYTIEGDTAIYESAKKTFNRTGLSNIYTTNGLFDNLLPDILNKLPDVDLVFFDGNHRMKPTLNYFEQCLTKINNNSIFIFDDIHWSKEMELAWEQIKAHPKTMVTLDLFQMGIVFFREELSKEHFIIRY